MRSIKVEEEEEINKISCLPVGLASLASRLFAVYLFGKENWMNGQSTTGTPTESSFIAVTATRL